MPPCRHGPKPQEDGKCHLSLSPNLLFCWGHDGLQLNFYVCQQVQILTAPAQIGAISAPICAFCRHSLGGFSIVSVQPCLLFSYSGSKMGQAQFCNRDEQNSIIAKSRHDIYGLSEPYSAICCISLCANRSFAQPYCINKSLSKYLIACSLSQILHFTADHCHTRNSVLL